MSSADNTQDNPLDDYFDALLSPAEMKAEADWNSLLSDAVEPFKRSTTEESPVFSASTLGAGYEPVIAKGIGELNPSERFSIMLLTLRLVKPLPQSRLRQVMLDSCQTLITSLNPVENTAWSAAAGRVRETLGHE